MCELLETLECKLCVTCRKSKPLAEFDRTGDTEDAYAAHLDRCKACEAKLKQYSCDVCGLAKPGKSFPTIQLRNHKQDKHLRCENCQWDCCCR